MTKLEYELLSTCEVKILSIKNSEGVPVPDERWAEANENWLSYLQGKATTDFDKKNGVPSAARKIFRSGNAGALYCEIDESGRIKSAYTIPTWWVEADNRWVTNGKETVKIVNGELSAKELHTKEVMRCY